MTNSLREAIEAVRAAVEYDLPMTPVAVILLCDEAEKALAELTKAGKLYDQWTALGAQYTDLEKERDRLLRKLGEAP